MAQGPNIQILWRSSSRSRFRRQASWSQIDPDAGIVWTNYWTAAALFLAEVSDLWSLLVLIFVTLSGFLFSFSLLLSWYSWAQLRRCAVKLRWMV